MAWNGIGGINRWWQGQQEYETSSDAEAAACKEKELRESLAEGLVEWTQALHQSIRRVGHDRVEGGALRVGRGLQQPVEVRQISHDEIGLWSKSRLLKVQMDAASTLVLAQKHRVVNVDSDRLHGSQRRACHKDARGAAKGVEHDVPGTHPRYRDTLLSRYEWKFY
eukprot:2091002-Rhodomonas_salina.2